MNSLITYEEFKKSFDKHKNSVIEISPDEITFLWFDDFYDGILCGILEYKGIKYRFEIISNFIDNYASPRIFAVISMTQDQIDEEVNWNKLFQKHVGNHTNLDSNGPLLQQPQDAHHFFYDEYKAKYQVSYDKNKVEFWYAEK